MSTNTLRAYELARAEYHRRIYAAMNWITVMILTMLISTLSILFAVVYTIIMNRIPLLLTIQK